MNLYNCHTHIFNLSCAPTNFTDLFVPYGLRGLVKPLLQLEGLSKLTRKLTRFPRLSKYASFVSIGTLTSQDSVFKQLTDYYPAGTRFVVLTLNMDYMGAGPSKLGYIGQLDQVIQIKKRFPDTCLPFLSLDPRMAADYDLVAFLKYYLQRGFVGIKLYPALGYFPFDPRLDKVYAFAAENQIPIMTHCTKGGIFYSGAIDTYMQNPANFSDSPFRQPPYPWSKNEEFCDFFVDPDAYRDVLQKYKNLKLCFAHFGGDDQILIADSKPQDNWFLKIKQLLQDYPQVYTDISYTLHEKKVFPKLKNLMQQPELAKKILFGTDFFMTEREKEERLLAVEIAEYLGMTIFKKIANANPKAYLSSVFYTAP